MKLRASSGPRADVIDIFLVIEKQELERTIMLLLVYIPQAFCQIPCIVKYLMNMRALHPANGCVKSNITITLDGVNYRFCKKPPLPFFISCKASSHDKSEY
jgi:hypothetical protein